MNLGEFVEIFSWLVNGSNEKSITIRYFCSLCLYALVSVHFVNENRNNGEVSG